MDIKEKIMCYELVDGRTKADLYASSFEVI